MNWITALKTHLHFFTFPHHKWVYAIFLIGILGMLCMLAVIAGYLWKERMTYIAIVIGVLIAACGAYLHFAILFYHERAYAIFLGGILCMLAVVAGYLWKERRYISSHLGGMATCGLGGGAICVIIGSYFLLNSGTLPKTSALVSLSGACLLAVYAGVFLIPLIYRMRKKEQRNTI